MKVNEQFKTLANLEKESLVAMAGLLLQVSNRVSSLKLASENRLSIHGCGCIDKLEGYLKDAISSELVIKRCKENGLHCEPKYKNDNKFYLCVSIGNQVIDLHLGHHSKQEARKWSTNPSKVASIDELESNLITVLGLDVLRSDLYRIDFAVDIPRPYSEIVRDAVIKYKRATSEYSFGSKDTGIRLGKGNDKLSIYDKALEQKVDGDLTRLERQISSKGKIKKAFGIKSFKDLRYSLGAILEFDPFSFVELKKTTLLRPSGLSHEQSSRFNELEALIKHNGLFVAKKKLSKNRNFNRDYGVFISQEPYEYQPSQIFEEDICSYFSRREL